MLSLVKAPSTQFKHLLFGDLVERLYTAYGNRRAKGIICLLVKSQLVTFSPRPGPLSNETVN
jgi:hypothetical protein